MGSPGYLHFCPADYRFEGSHNIPHSGLIICQKDLQNSGKSYPYYYILQFIIRGQMNGQMKREIQSEGSQAQGPLSTWSWEVCHPPGTWMCLPTRKPPEPHYLGVFIEV